MGEVTTGSNDEFTQYSDIKIYLKLLCKVPKLKLIDFDFKILFLFQKVFSKECFNEFLEFAKQM
jgi:hypothetical protein